MIILPAIDLKDGTCVRLTRGDFATAAKVAEDPEETALGFAAAGARWLHMVDLDGALAGHPVNHRVVSTVRKKVGLSIQVGGGIRAMSHIEDYLAMGIDRIILGSVALKNPDLVRDAVKKWGDAIAVGIDAMDGRVRAEGWTEDSDVDYLELAGRMADAGVATIIYTDISRDGTLSGPNLAQLEDLRREVQLQVIASGGIRDLSDIRRLTELDLWGAICGKSIYSGSLNLKEAVEIAEKDGIVEKSGVAEKDGVAGAPERKGSPC